MNIKPYHISLLCLFILPAVTVAATPWKDCGSTAGKVSNVAVSGCSAPPCVLKKGTNVTFEIDFNTMSSAVSKATAVIHGIVAGLPIPFPFAHPNACLNCNLSCPLKPNKPYKYITTLFVKTSYPAVELTVKWELKTQTSKDLACVELPVKISS